MLRRSQIPSIGNTARKLEEPPSQHVWLPKRRLAQVWRQPGIVLTLLLSDVLLAVLVWLGGVRATAHLGPVDPDRVGGLPQRYGYGDGVSAVAVWIGLRSLMGLYPGYGLSSEERLRRHTYSVIGAAAAVSIAIVLGLGDIASRFIRFYELSTPAIGARLCGPFASPLGAVWRRRVEARFLGQTRGRHRR